jgi:hypothetical protein
LPRGIVNERVARGERALKCDLQGHFCKRRILRLGPLDAGRIKMKNEQCLSRPGRWNSFMMEPRRARSSRTSSHVERQERRGTWCVDRGQRISARAAKRKAAAGP